MGRSVGLIFAVNFSIVTGYFLVEAFAVVFGSTYMKRQFDYCTQDQLACFKDVLSHHDLDYPFDIIEERFSFRKTVDYHKIKRPASLNDKEMANKLSKDSVETMMEILAPGLEIPLWVAGNHSLHWQGCLSNINQFDASYSRVCSIGSSYKFVFFLGAQGKEFIGFINDMFPRSSHSSVFFITCNYQKEASHDRCNISNNHQCFQLASELNIVDPLGGGNYPLDYFLLVDDEYNIRCLIPLVIRENSSVERKNYTKSFRLEGGSTYARFGISLAQLDSFIDEYLVYLRQ